jgi:predicted nucleic acid-binding protein
MLIADTSPLVAILNAKDKRHQARTALFRRFRTPVIAPAPIITEVAYFLQIEPGPVVDAAFLDASARGELVVEATTVRDLARMADLVRQYTDSPRRSASPLRGLRAAVGPPQVHARAAAGQPLSWPRRRDRRSQSCQPRRGTGRQPGGQEEHGREHPTMLIPPT